MGVKIGPQTKIYAYDKGEARIRAALLRTLQASTERPDYREISKD